MIGPYNMGCFAVGLRKDDLFVPDSLAVAADCDDFRSDYLPDETEPKAVSMPIRPNGLLHHDYYQLALLKVQ